MRVENDQDGGKSARRRWNAYKRGWKEITRVQREQEKRLGENERVTRDWVRVGRGERFGEMRRWERMTIRRNRENVSVTYLTWRSLVVLKKKPTLKCMAILFKLVHVNGSFFTVSEFLLIWLLSLNNKHPNQLITLEAILSSSSLSNVKWEVKALAWPWLLNKQRLTSGPRTTPCSNLSYNQEHRWSDFNQNGPQQNKLTQNIYQC